MCEIFRTGTQQEKQFSLPGGCTGRFPHTSELREMESLPANVLGVSTERWTWLASVHFGLLILVSPDA
jgi:hypothetical protein